MKNLWNLIFLIFQILLLTTNVKAEEGTVYNYYNESDVMENSNISPSDNLADDESQIIEQEKKLENYENIKRENEYVTFYPQDTNYISKNTAVLRTLDKKTGRYNTINVRVGEVLEFGKIKAEIKACYSKPPEETPEDAVFLDIKDTNSNIKIIQNQEYEQEYENDENNNTLSSDVIFRGWMFSSSPSLSAMQHPIYDIWLINCKNTSM